MKTILFIALVASATSLRAQEPLRAALYAGDRVRIRVLNESVTGNLESLSRDSVVIATGNSSYRAALTNVRNIEISKGMRSQARDGMQLGSLLGAAAGALISLTSREMECADSDAICGILSVPFGGERGLQVMLGGAAGAVAGAALGAIIGSNSRVERWINISNWK